MKHLRLCAPAGLAVAAVLLGQTPALAQGATGGNIGNRDKGVSGAFDTPSAPSRREAPARSRKSSGGGGGGNFDGQWKSVAVSNNGCSGTATAVVTISNGQVSTNDGLSGRVSGGSLRANWAGNGMTGTVTGRLSGQSGSGSFRRSDGCTGSWSMVKQ